MKLNKSKYCLFAVNFLLATGLISTSTLAASQNNPSVVTYPATKDINKAFKSSHFTVSLKQKGKEKNSFVYSERNSAHPGWSGALDYMQDANHWTNFSFQGSVDVKAQRLDKKKIKSCIVRPLSLGIKTRIEGNKCLFKISKPANMSVEIDEGKNITQNISDTGYITKNIVKHPLFIFANPLEGNRPTSKGRGVVYFGPGIHKIGKGFKIPNNTQVYIAGGAYVIGNLVSAQSNPQNIIIRGRGILSGYNLKESKAEQKKWGNHAIDFSKGNKGKGLLIDGITITNPLRSCIVSYNPVTIRNVKLMSWSHRNDGIVGGNNSVIEDSFLKVMDDNLKIYYSNQIIRNNVIWQQTSGAVFKLAWNLNGKAQNNQVSNIDIIHSDVFNDYPLHEPDRSDLSSKSAIFSAMGLRKNSVSQNNTFKNIRIEDKHLLRLMSMRMVSTHILPTGEKTIWGDPNKKSNKAINNLKFENISVAGVPYKPSTLYGNAGGKINNISFTNLRVGNERIQSRSQLSSKIDGTGLSTAGNVGGINFR